MINFFKEHKHQFIKALIKEGRVSIFDYLGPSDSNDWAMLGMIAIVVIGVSAVLFIMNFAYRYFMKKMADKGYIDRPIYIESIYKEGFRRIIESDTSISSISETPESNKFRQVCSKIVEFLNKAFNKVKPVLSFITKTISYFASSIKERIKKVLSKYHNNPDEVKAAIEDKKNEIIRISKMPVFNNRLKGIEHSLPDFK